MIKAEKESNWYVVRTKSNAEKKVEERLRENGFEVFLPLVESIRIWSDRKKKLLLPLISGLVFVHIQPERLKELYGINGVAYILLEFGRPAIVREQEIKNLRILSMSGFQPEWFHMELISDGDDVEVIAGPFQGMKGSCINVRNDYKLTISFPGIQLAFSVSMNRNQVKRINK